LADKNFEVGHVVMYGGNPALVRKVMTEERRLEVKVYPHENHRGYIKVITFRDAKK